MYFNTRLVDRVLPASGRNYSAHLASRAPAGQVSALYHDSRLAVRLDNGLRAQHTLQVSVPTLPAACLQFSVSCMSAPLYVNQSITLQVPLDAQHVTGGSQAVPALHAQTDDDAPHPVHAARLRRLHAQQRLHQRDRCAVSRGQSHLAASIIFQWKMHFVSELKQKEVAAIPGVSRSKLTAQL